MQISGILWTEHSERKDYKYALAETGVAVDTTHKTTAKLVTSMEQEMLVLPQHVFNLNNDQTVDENYDYYGETVSDFALEVIYDVSNLKNQKKNILLVDEYAFRSNEQYAITVNFTGKGITFDISVTPFADIEPVTTVP